MNKIIPAKLIFKENTIYSDRFDDIYGSTGGYKEESNHIFIDGNKRTALATAITFLHLNGTYFDPFDDETTFSKMKHFAMSTSSPSDLVPEVADWLESMCME